MCRGEGIVLRIPRIADIVRVMTLVAAIGGLLIFAGCGGGGGDGGGGGGNHDPVISSLTATSNAVWPQGSTQLTASASDNDGDALSYSWSAGRGSVQGSGATVTFTAPDTGGSITVSVAVTDGNGGQDSAQIAITVGATAQGSVVDVDDTSPVAGATVNIDGLTADTDTNGQFSITGLHEGTHEVFLTGDWVIAGSGVTVRVDTPGETVTIPSPIQAIDVGGGPPPPPFD